VPEDDRRDLATLLLKPREVVHLVFFALTLDEIGVRVVPEGPLDLAASNSEPKRRQVLAGKESI
jgi:hypothetical protein